MKKQILGVLLFSSILPHISHAQNIESFHPSFPKFSQDETQRKQSNQFYPLGQAQFPNQVTVPVYGVTVENPIDDGLLTAFKPCTKNTCVFTSKLNKKDAEQLKLLAIPSIGYILVPKNWTDISASAGANGTGSALIMSSKQNEAITVYNSSFCVGCGLPHASLYFPKLLKQSLASEFGGMKDPNKKLTLVYPSPTTAFFSYQIPHLNNKTHGIAQYMDDGDFNFVNIHVTLTKDHQHLATPILNFYHATQ